MECTYYSKCGTILTFKKVIGNTLLDACDKDSDDSAILLMRVSKLIRKEIFQKEYRFNGSLIDEKHSNLPVLLQTLITMILGDSDVKQCTLSSAISRAASSIT